MSYGRFNHGGARHEAHLLGEPGEIQSKIPIYATLSISGLSSRLAFQEPDAKEKMA